MNLKLSCLHFFVPVILILGACTSRPTIISEEDFPLSQLRLVSNFTGDEFECRFEYRKGDSGKWQSIISTTTDGDYGLGPATSGRVACNPIASSANLRATLIYVSLKNRFAVSQDGGVHWKEIILDKEKLGLGLFSIDIVHINEDGSGKMQLFNFDSKSRVTLFTRNSGIDWQR